MSTTPCGIILRSKLLLQSCGVLPVDAGVQIVCSVCRKWIASLRLEEAQDVVGISRIPASIVLSFGNLG